MALEAFVWKDRDSLIEHLLPVQQISVESYKEQMAGAGKTLTALGSYWKGRKPLILNKACILGCLLPTSIQNDDLEFLEGEERTKALRKDLEIYEMLMGMDSESLEKRLKNTLKITDHATIKEDWLDKPYREQVSKASRPEELKDEELFSHIWTKVNAHLGTSASSFPELVEQLGIARFGRRPKVADLFSGSGQIPFEAARLGCDVYASDLNPIACMLTWGAFNIVGASDEKRKEIEKAQTELANKVQAEIDALGVEDDGNGWKAKVFLYCIEVTCPESGWKVPVLSTLVVSQGRGIIAKLRPDAENKRYIIDIVEAANKDELKEAKTGTYQKGYVVHSPDGEVTYRNAISTIRGDYKEDGENKNKLRMWEKSDFVPQADDIYQERLYCIQWMKQKPDSKQYDYDFRAIGDEDLAREQKVIDYISENLEDWQEKGFVPDMVIESGAKTDEPIRTRGWTHWHHLFNARQLLIGGLVNKFRKPASYPAITQMHNYSARLSRWAPQRDTINSVFDNQALNTQFIYGCRSNGYSSNLLLQKYQHFPISSKTTVQSHPANQLEEEIDVFVTDPPYGDAVNYHEIYEFFIAWLRKNPPAEFANWTWDSRRDLAIKGDGEEFRQGMVAAYQRMADKMPENGIQVLMFTHKSDSIWADLANIVWASGLTVSAAWYVVTETDTALKGGAHVTGTIMLVLRKRFGNLDTTRQELGWMIKDAVKEQVESLAGLDKQLRDQGSEGLYNDADLQMAGYAAALKALTFYSIIDGKDMKALALEPRIKGQKTMVDDLIEFAVQEAIQHLIPRPFTQSEWKSMTAIERFYLKMADMESQGYATLDNYTNFAKAFRTKGSETVMADGSKANSARLTLGIEMGRAHMAGEVEIAGTGLRALLYAFNELSKDVDADDVIEHLISNAPNYYNTKPLLIKICRYLSDKRSQLQSTKTYDPHAEAKFARILAEAIAAERKL